MLYNKTFKFVPALRASTVPKKAVPFWAAELRSYVLGQRSSSGISNNEIPSSRHPN